ncbi:TRAP transporter small permease subunit [Allopusillimonas ginsengisoli]|uniref:TRAP transporter small permease subunit n=1 Tax=Allopusillimonas ginsengisoli TaxID=453575 RepID=UPI00101F9AD4|nr:TRAP transporter small permease subunit [Allopusillimonas ginsengisoli]TEA79740.1 TRAP transporter small permease subunit [Allopusillimonas ginsengisoli]
MTRTYVDFIERLSRLCGVLSALLLIFAMLVVCEMIVIRYILRAATIWQTEAVVFSATAAIFLGAPYVLMTKGHVGVDVIQMLVKPRTRLRMERTGALLGMVFCITMVVATAIHLYEALEGGWTTPSVAAIPLWMPLAPMLVGLLLLSLQYVAELIKLAGEPT